MHNPSAKDSLRAWITAHADTPDDAARASSLIAAYVAECVRRDRDAQREKAERTVQARQKFEDLVRQFYGTPFGAGRHG